MKLNPVANYNNNNFHPAFGVNLKSPKLKFKYDDFYVNIDGYGRNSRWADMIISTADSAVKQIRKYLDFEYTLKLIAEGVRLANHFTEDNGKQLYTGVLRTKREHWLSLSDRRKKHWIITRYDGANNKYSEYKDRLDETISNPLRNPFRNFMLTRPVHTEKFGKFLEHSEPYYINDTFNILKESYDYLMTNYIKKPIKEDDIDDVNYTVAKIRWVLAHSTPWKRGSDAISNTFIRSLYKAIGIKTSPLKKGISLDLEAYCTELKDYQTNFASYFTEKPYIIE